MKIGVVPKVVANDARLPAERAVTSAAMMAASERSHGSGRFSAIQAAPGAMSASAIVSQPFSSAKANASANAASAPVA